MKTMKFTLLACISLITWAISACKNSVTETKAPIQDTVAEKKKQFFPVLDFITSEIRAVDSLPIGIKMYTTKGNVLDSSYIKAEEFDRLAAEFTAADLEPGKFQMKYTETSFYDNTTKASSFVYTPVNNEDSVRRVNVLVTEGSAYDKVSGIYIEKFTSQNDSSVMRKLYWKPGKQFQINSEIQVPDKSPVVTQVRVVWNTEEDE
jgi:hypothetical protein